MSEENDLSEPKPIESVLWGREIEVPEVIKETLLDREKVLHAIQQSRLQQMLTPDSIFITNKRVIIHRPTTFGLRRTIQDYKFVDMANTKIKQGFISSDIEIRMRFLSEPVLLKRIPTKEAREMFKTIQEGIENRLAVPVQETVFKPPLTEAFLEQPKTETKLEKEDLLAILQKRYITGEITKKEYLEMKNELVPTATKKSKREIEKVKKRISKRKKKR